MKYWNKQKHLRERCWHRVELPLEKMMFGGPGGYKGWTWVPAFNRAKRELQLEDSNGKFYMTILKKEIWFQREEDATLFLLKYMP